MTTGRHRSTWQPPARTRHGRHAPVPVPVQERRGLALRGVVLSSSAVVTVAGLSLAGILPANAATLLGDSQPRASVTAGLAPERATTVTPAAFTHTQSYSVPVSTATSASPALLTSRDGYSATSPHELAVRVAAAAAARAAVAGKAAVIAAILATPVTVVSLTNPVTGQGTGTDQDPGTDVTDPADAALVTTSTSGTVADRVSAETLGKASATANEIVAAAVQYVGVVPYVHGGATPEGGFDCSGLVLYVYAKFGITVPHDVDGIAALGTEITADELQPGDLVVYPHQHIGIYIGDGYMVDAPNVGRDVEVQAVWGAPVFVHVDGA